MRGPLTSGAGASAPHLATACWAWPNGWASHVGLAGLGPKAAQCFQRRPNVCGLAGFGAAAHRSGVAAAVCACVCVRGRAAETALARRSTKCLQGLAGDRRRARSRSSGRARERPRVCALHRAPMRARVRPDGRPRLGVAPRRQRARRASVTHARGSDQRRPKVAPFTRSLQGGGGTKAGQQLHRQLGSHSAARQRFAGVAREEGERRAMSSPRARKSSSEGRGWVLRRRWGSGMARSWSSALAATSSSRWRRRRGSSRSPPPAGSVTP